MKPPLLVRVSVVVAASTAGSATALADQTQAPETPAGPSTAAPPAPSAPSPQVVYVREERPSVFGPRYRSPGLAAALSLTPIPIDFGNLYAENVGWGVAYSSVELALGGGMMWLGADHMCHRDGCSSWSGAETAGMIALATGYVAVKVVSGIHAAGAARDFNEHAAAWFPMVIPIRSGAAASVALPF